MIKKEKEREVPAVLTIAGSDSGGSAGIQADLKTFSALKVFGTSAVTCVTAQSPCEIRNIMTVDPEMVALQIRTVCEALPVSAVKTGMLYSAEMIWTVAEAISACEIPMLVVDPVMSATSGAMLLRADALNQLTETLFPKAVIITPNVPETEILCGRALGSVKDMKDAAVELSGKYKCACVIKGGHLGEGSCVERDKDVFNVLCNGGVLSVSVSPRLNVPETHGTGCTFSAALTAFLALGERMEDAVTHATDFVARVLLNGVWVGDHRVLWDE